MPATTTLPTTLKLLADPTRLRLCALLALEELAVQELVAITGCAQSRVSNHLALLKRQGLATDRREGTWSFYRLAEPHAKGPLTPELFAAAIAPSLAGEVGRADLAAVEAVREKRREQSRRSHDRLAAAWGGSLQEWDRGSLRAEVFAALVPQGLVLADIGCGNGFLTKFLVGKGARVIAVDHSKRMLEQARRGLARRAEFRKGELDELPLADAEVDAAFANLVWHHVADAHRAARELFRVIKPGGFVVISDLLPHGEEWLRDAMGDLRLGLKPEQVITTLARAGFAHLSTEPLEDRYLVTGKDGERASLAMFLVRGTKPGIPQPNQRP